MDGSMTQEGELTQSRMNFDSLEVQVSASVSTPPERKDKVVSEAEEPYRASDAIARERAGKGKPVPMPDDVREKIRKILGRSDEKK